MIRERMRDFAKRLKSELNKIKENKKKFMPSSMKIQVISARPIVDMMKLERLFASQLILKH